MQTELAKALAATPEEAKKVAQRLARMFLTSCMRQPALLDCSQQSIALTLLSAAQLGLEIDGRHAHAVPFKNHKKGGQLECQLIPDYKGLVQVVMRSGLISSIHADAVCDKDEFEVDRGRILKHRINYREPRGPAYAYYVLVTFKDGSEKCEVMTVDEIEQVRARSKASDDGPWQTDYNEMAKKTVFKRAYKWLPVSAEVAMAVDEVEHRIDKGDLRPYRAETIDISASPVQPSFTAQTATAPSKKPSKKATGPAPETATNEHVEQASPNDSQPEITLDAETPASDRSKVAELIALAAQDDIDETEVEIWMQSRQMSIKSETDCARVINAWSTAKGLILSRRPSGNGGVA
jgi:recombination protein RecT